MTEIREKILQSLEEKRVFLQAHGGDLEVVGIEGKTVRLKLKGGCSHCPNAMMTVKSGLERALREEIDPEIVIERVL